MKIKVGDVVRIKKGKAFKEVLSTGRPSDWSSGVALPDGLVVLDSMFKYQGRLGVVTQVYPDLSRVLVAFPGALSYYWNLDLIHRTNIKREDLGL